MYVAKITDVDLSLIMHRIFTIGQVIKDWTEENRACSLAASRVYQLIHCCDS